MKYTSRKYLILTLILLLATIVASGIGAMYIPSLKVVAILLDQIHLNPGWDFAKQEEAVLLQIRLPRVLLSMLVGASLAVSGVALQGLFRNPLAAPSLIGITSGATLSAALYIVGGGAMGFNVSSWFGSYGLALFAFIGACAVGALVYRLATIGGRTAVTTLLLGGIAIQALTAAFTSFLIFAAKDDQLRDLTFWTMGSLGGASWKNIETVLPLMLPPLIILPRMGRALNAMSLGEEGASLLGFKVQRLKWTLFALSTLAVGACVAVSGTIGFVGLVVPHLVRKQFGSDYRGLVLTSALFGAILVVIADLGCRTLLAPAELPIGILTAFIGTPVFLRLLIVNRKKQASWA